MSSIIMQSLLQSTSQPKQKINLKNCRQKYPHMIPVSVDVQQGIKINKTKFLISEDATGFEFQKFMFKYIESVSNLSLYCFIVDPKKKHRMLPYDAIMKNTYHLYENEDGYLKVYLRYADTF